MVICLERGAGLHMAQLMPLPLTVSCFSKIQTGFTFLVPAHLGSPGQRAVKRVCVCVCFGACGSVSELLKVRDDLTAERDDKVREIAGLREKVAASQESELKLEKERDEAQNKLQEVIIIPEGQFFGRHCSSFW